MENSRTNVECAGLCMSYNETPNECFAFALISSTTCTVYREHGLCEVTNLGYFVRGYIEAGKTLPACPGRLNIRHQFLDQCGYINV